MRHKERPFSVTHRPSRVSMTTNRAIFQRSRRIFCRTGEWCDQSFLRVHCSDFQRTYEKLGDKAILLRADRYAREQKLQCTGDEARVILRAHEGVRFAGARRAHDKHTDLRANALGTKTLIAYSRMHTQDATPQPSGLGSHCSRFLCWRQWQGQCPRIFCRCECTPRSGDQTNYSSCQRALQNLKRGIHDATKTTCQEETLWHRHLRD